MAAEPRTTPEGRAALRARYTPGMVPRCGVCGGAMANADAVGNRLPRRETWWRCPAHPVQRAFTAPLAGGDPDVLAACDDADALADARAEAAALRDLLRAARDRVDHTIVDLVEARDGLDAAGRALRRLREALQAIERDATAAASPPRADPTGVADSIRRTARAALGPGEEGTGT